MSNLKEDVDTFLSAKVLYNSTYMKGTYLTPVSDNLSDKLSYLLDSPINNLGGITDLISDLKIDYIRVGEYAELDGDYKTVLKFFNPDDENDFLFMASTRGSHGSIKWVQATPRKVEVTVYDTIA